jgi:hypothetical protein
MKRREISRIGVKEMTTTKFQDIQVGDTVHYSTPQGQTGKGKTVIKVTGSHVVINRGKGQPQVVTPKNYIKHTKNRGKSKAGFEFPSDRKIDEAPVHQGVWYPKSTRSEAPVRIQVRSDYAHHYMQKYNGYTKNARPEFGPKSAAKRAREDAYGHIKDKYGQEIHDKLKKWHDDNDRADRVDAEKASLSNENTELGNVLGVGLRKSTKERLSKEAKKLSGAEKTEAKRRYFRNARHNYTVARNVAKTIRKESVDTKNESFGRDPQGPRPKLDRSGKLITKKTRPMSQDDKDDRGDREYQYKKENPKNEDTSASGRFAKLSLDTAAGSSEKARKEIEQVRGIRKFRKIADTLQKKKIGESKSEPKRYYSVDSTGMNQRWDKFFDQEANLKTLHKKAAAESKKHGAVQHINKTPNGHEISNWYDSDNTVASYVNGKLKEDAHDLEGKASRVAITIRQKLLKMKKKKKAAKMIRDDVLREVSYRQHGIWNAIRDIKKRQSDEFHKKVQSGEIVHFGAGKTAYNPDEYFEHPRYKGQRDFDKERSPEEYARFEKAYLANRKKKPVTESAAPGQEDWIRANKARFIKEYGKEKGLRILYAERAIQLAKLKKKGGKTANTKPELSMPTSSNSPIEATISNNDGIANHA